jgi:FMN phosphatase YigB (HAD superfamily)
MLKIIALDICGVCINLNYEKALNTLGIKGLADMPIEFTAATNLLKKGVITNVEWSNVICYLTENKFSENELRTAWSMIIGDTIKGMPELAKELVDAGYELVFFSDMPELHMHDIYRNLSFANLVTGKVCSYQIGSMKPDRTMYEAFERKYGKPAFFADDNPENIEAGQCEGWESHLFTSPENMRTALVDTRIL